ncbi:DUF5333 domain-containing protein [Yoonia sp. SDW83-1]|uniref:DUF5333 domain-containing protein n=1 Tax=Yoonia sp. SDW83-1 TaxID=3366945 RepID=UPI00398C4483
MTKTPAFIAALTVATVALAGNLSAQTALKDEIRVRDGIVHVGMAYEISEKCSSIRARTFRGISFLQELKNYALEQGYSEAEVEAYVKDKEEERRLIGIARTQLARLGVVEGDEASYCAVGRDQIERNTRVGWLLR